MMEALVFSETPDLTRASRRKIPEGGCLPRKVLALGLEVPAQRILPITNFEINVCNLIMGTVALC
jgi:hypothetical protein